MKKYDAVVIEAIGLLNERNKMPPLHVVLPYEEHDVGGITIACNIRASDPSLRLSFETYILPDDFIFNSNVDKDAHIPPNKLPLETKIALRIAYRIYMQYIDIVETLASKVNREVIKR